MPNASETAYPRIKANMSEQELAEIYTPTSEEISFVSANTRSPISKLGLLLLLKTFQRLGYFLMIPEIPQIVICNISICTGFARIPEEIYRYDSTISRPRHMNLIRSFLGVVAYGEQARRCMVKALVETSRTKDEVADIINVAIEELIRQHFELPAFSTLLRAAKTARSTVNRGYHRLIYNLLGEASTAKLDILLKRNPSESRSPWDKVKREPKSPTITHMKEFLDHLNWLKEQNVGADIFATIPVVKVKQFAAEARSLDLSSINDLVKEKRYTLVAALIREQIAKAFDDVAEMFLRRMQKMHRKAKEALILYRSEHAETADLLIALLKDTVIAYKKEGTIQERFDAMETVIGTDPDNVMEKCEAHGVYAGNNFFPFLPKFYRSQRSALFSFIESVKLLSTSQDTSVEQAINFLLEHKSSRSDWIEVVQIKRERHLHAEISALVDLSWVTEKWWKLVTGNTATGQMPIKVDRRYFELCLFSQIMLELKSADLGIPDSGQFSDYRRQLISLEEYNRTVDEYGNVVGLPIEAKAFVKQLREHLEIVAESTDNSFPKNEFLRIEKGQPVLSRLERKAEPIGLKAADKLIKERTPGVNILDVIADTQYWLNWTEPFGPISGHETKIDNVDERYVINTFCYGCDLGPTQTSRSIKGVDRKQISFINQRHVSEEKLDKVIVLVINRYNQFALPKLWGSGETVSADGMKWDLYEQNLLSEYHIRYGGYGGLGYYHVSDTYIALFSQFTACGVWEGINILEGLLKNESDIQPDTIHSDTQGQSAAIFGLAYLLGIKLMPRIRNWKDLKLYRPTKESRYKHIDELVSDNADWDLIETLLPDMLRVAMSIKAGLITSSTILRKLGTYSRKNRLYLAFRELGRVVRTVFLLQYVSDVELRRTIQSATNKSEAFNKFVQWVFFGGNGIIAENIREEQRKIIKYNHLVANLLIFHNVVSMTNVINELAKEGYKISHEVLAALSPYQTEHINRFGNYALNLDRKPPPLEFNLPIDEN